MYDRLSDLVKAILVGALLANGPAITRAQEPPQVVSVTLGNYRYMPDTIVVQAGRPVVLTLTNTDRFTPHNFTLKDADAGLDISTNVSAGNKAVIEFTPQKPGTYTFFCNKKLLFLKSHRDRGMEGTLRVMAPAKE